MILSTIWQEEGYNKIAPTIKMLNPKFKTFKFLFVVLTFAFYLLNFTGCATVPVKEALPSYDINGVKYFSLVAFCGLRGVDWQYDTFTKTMVLTKDTHRINLRVGDTLVLVDGRAQVLLHPVDIYQGEVIAPYRFKEQTLDDLFKEVYPARKGIVQISKIKKVVIDAGHGGNDPGAIGKSGLREKDVNLDIARRLSKILESRGVKAVMTRSSDRFVPLSRRVEIANDSGAGLFISVHANANRVRSLNGLEVYYVAPSVSDTKRASATARVEPLNIDRACFASSSLDLKTTLWDMIYTSSRAESIELSRAICRSMDDNLGVRVIGAKGARFEVLRGVRTPAVLVEVGFLSNRNEERMLKNNFYRQQVAEAIVAGVADYSRDYTFMEASKR